MKILVVSDTHGHEENLKKVMEKVSPIDLLIHCGDVESGENRVASICDCPVEMVRGNNDYFTSLPSELEFTLGEYNIWVTHGHMQQVSLHMDVLRQEAINRFKNVVFFGHSHRPLIDISEYVTLVNPGSLSYPRQEGRRPSYIIAEIDRLGELHYTISYL